MTDRQLIKNLIEKITQKIVYEDGLYIDIENLAFGENISFEFDEDGNLIKIMS